MTAGRLNKRQNLTNNKWTAADTGGRLSVISLSSPRQSPSRRFEINVLFYPVQSGWSELQMEHVCQHMGLIYVKTGIRTTSKVTIVAEVQIVHERRRSMMSLALTGTLCEFSE